MNLATILALTRPIAILDLETTGLDTSNDRIVQIAVAMYYPNKAPVSWQALVNPTVPIPTSASAIHGITDKQVVEAHTFRAMAPKLAATLMNVDFGGANIEFDLKMLRMELRRSGVDWDWELNGSNVIDILKIYRILDPRGLDAAYRRFVDPAGFKDAHDAAADVTATVAVLFAQLEQNPNIPRDVAALAEFCSPRDPTWIDRTGKIVWKNDEACLGPWSKKHSGVPLRLVNAGYLNWITANDFPFDTKQIVMKALEGKFPSRDIIDKTNATRTVADGKGEKV